MKNFVDKSAKLSVKYKNTREVILCGTSTMYGWKCWILWENRGYKNKLQIGLFYASEQTVQERGTKKPLCVGVLY